MSTKTMKELCVSRRLSLFLGAGYLPVRLSVENSFLLLQKLTEAGNLPRGTEITVTKMS